MEIINKKHEDYVINKKTSEVYIHFGQNKQRFSISAGAVKEFKLKEGMYIHFATDVDRLYIYLNHDKHGIRATENHSGLFFWSSPIMKMLMERVGLITPASKFPLRKSNTNVQGSIALEVMLHKKFTKRKRK